MSPTAADQANPAAEPSAQEESATDPSNDTTESNAGDGGNTAVQTEANDTAELSLEEQLAAAQAKADEHWDLYVRAKAEEENARRRADQEVSKARKFALERFSNELLNVVDNLEMGLAASEQGTVSIESLKEGSDLTLKQLIQVLERFGVKSVAPEGEKFNPQLHEALSIQPSAEHEPNTVLNVVQKGYTLNERLLRPARVIVSSKPSA